jgi:hypothetical protein
VLAGLAPRAQHAPDFLDKRLRLLDLWGHRDDGYAGRRIVGTQAFPERRVVAQVRYDEIGPQRMHHAERLLGGMGGRDRETKLRQDSFTPGAAPLIIVCDEDERGKAVLILGAPPAAGLAPTIRSKPPIWD